MRFNEYCLKSVFDLFVSVACFFLNQLLGFYLALSRGE